MQQQGQQLLEMHTRIEQQLEPRLRAHSHSEAPPDLAYVVRERQLALSLVGLTAEEGTPANVAELVHNSQSSAAVADASLPDLTSSAAAPPLHAPQPALPVVQPPPQSFLGLPTPTNHSRVLPAAAAVQQLAQQTFPSAPVITSAKDGPQGVTCGHCHAGSGVRCTWVPRKALHSQVELY